MGIYKLLFCTVYWVNLLIYDVRVTDWMNVIFLKATALHILIHYILPTVLHVYSEQTFWTKCKHEMAFHAKH